MCIVLNQFGSSGERRDARGQRHRGQTADPPRKTWRLVAPIARGPGGIFVRFFPDGGDTGAPPRRSRDFYAQTVFPLRKSLVGSLTMPDAEILDMTRFDLLNELPDSPDASIPSQNRERHRLRRLAVRRHEAARLMGVSVSTWRRWERSEAIPASLTVGRVALWSMRTLRVWMEWGCPSRRAFEAMEAAKE